ncbi:MAG: hypothetical protein JWN52_3311 [Actinomycetia bacterium]|jgi:hypothetical protein|nr:hypothetical protein [Actinomycetes bacterium]
MAVLLLPGMTACAQRKKTPTRPVAITSTPAPEALTPQVAAQALKEYINNEDVARASGDERLALSWAGDGQALLTAAEFRKSAFTGDPVPRYVYGKPTLYVPRLTSYPQWFVASVDRTVQGHPTSKYSALMAFNRASVSGRWKLSLSTLVLKGAKAPQIKVDPEGYATPLATFDGDLVIRPRDVQSIQAGMAEEGADNPGRRVMKPGLYTSGYYTQTQKAKKKAKDAGLTYEPVFTATTFPVFALRTVDGGGLVLYALSRNTVTYVRKKGLQPAVPREVAHLLDSRILKDQLQVWETLQFGVYDPAKPKTKTAQPKTDVIAQDGAATNAANKASS